MNNFRFFLGGCLLLCASAAQAQYDFVRSSNIPVTESGVLLENAWAGGMNFCQYSDIDLDLDGTKDLVVFDRSGDKLMTFINNGTSTNYTHAPEYEGKFPLISDWVLLEDYNCDGKEDIFI